MLLKSKFAMCFVFFYPSLSLSLLIYYFRETLMIKMDYIDTLCFIIILHIHFTSTNYLDLLTKNSNNDLCLSLLCYLRLKFPKLLLSKHMLTTV